MKSKRVHVVSNTHWDREHRHGFQETRFMLLETPQLVTVALSENVESISVISDASGTKEIVAVAEQCITVEVPPLNALLLDLSASLPAEVKIL